jgi:uncharacterized protein (DUF58 family)
LEKSLLRPSSRREDHAVTKITYLTDRFFVLIGTAQLVGVFGLVWAPFFYVYAAALPAIAVLAWLDWRALPPGSGLHCEGALSDAPEIGQEVWLGFRVSREGGRRLGAGEWRLAVPSLRTLEPLEARVSVTEIEGLSRARMHCRALALGYEEIKGVRLLVRSPLALWFRQYELEIEPISFRVMPSRREISEQAFRQLVHNTRTLSQGNRRIMRGRAAEQFYSLRKYQFPDQIRHIDQKKTAKYGELMTRTFENFLSHHLILALDLGHSMFGTIGQSQKHDFYLAACLTLARNGIHSHDRVSFFGFSQRIHSLIRSARSLDPFLPLYQGSPEVAPRDEEGNFDLLGPTLARVAGQRSIVLIFTDASRPSVQQSLLRVLPDICRRHLTVVISLIDEAYSLERQLESWDGIKLGMEEYSRFLYNYWIDDRSRIFRSVAARHSGGVVSVTEADWLSVVGRTYDMMRRSLQI